MINRLIGDEAEDMITLCHAVVEAVRSIGVSALTTYRWWTGNEGLSVSQTWSLGQPEA